MKLNQFAVYRVDQQTAGKALWHLPYQEARQQNVSITVENYRLVSIHEMQKNEKVISGNSNKTVEAGDTFRVRGLSAVIVWLGAGMRSQ